MCSHIILKVRKSQKIFVLIFNSSKKQRFFLQISANPLNSGRIKKKMLPISITAHLGWNRVVILKNQKFMKQKVRTYETIYKYVENLNRCQ